MREELVQCKECRFWVRHVEKELKPKPRMSDFGLCFQKRSVNWLLRRHKDMTCVYGELKKEGKRTH
jgi:hypothetical protein